jgi:hypothetical protein
LLPPLAGAAMLRLLYAALGTVPAAAMSATNQVFARHLSRDLRWNKSGVWRQRTPVVDHEVSQANSESTGFRMSHVTFRA